MSDLNQPWPVDKEASPPEYRKDLEDCSPFTPIEKSPVGRFRRHFESKINNQNADYVLLFCWFTTGLLDSTMFSAYRTFVSMQTGNTMFLGIGASDLDRAPRPYGWAKCLTSLCCFLLGAFFFSRFGRRFGPSRRSTLLYSFSLQAGIIFLCAILIQSGALEGRLEFIGDDIDWIHEIPIALLSFQAPGQVCLSRDMKFAEVPTVVITTVLYDFASDPNLLVGPTKNAIRNRRFFGFAMLLIGAITGGWVTRRTGHITIPMWMAAIIKTGIATAWVLWPSEEKAPRRWGH